jgi:hypothetical protein
VGIQDDAQLLSDRVVPLLHRDSIENERARTFGRVCSRAGIEGWLGGCEEAAIGSFQEI